MGVADKETKAYMRENEIFADAFNFFLYDGAQKIQPELLRELDTTELAELPGTDKKQLSEVIQKYRDVLKAAVIMQDEKASYLLLGIENQTDVHYAMPVRNMLYDVMQYQKQVSELAADHREHRAELKMTDDHGNKCGESHSGGDGNKIQDFRRNGGSGYVSGN